MNKQWEQGFSAVEGLLVLIIIALIGVVGYMVYQNKNKMTESITTTTRSAKSGSDSQAKPSPYEGWKTATLPNVKLSFKYPSIWTVTDESSPSPTVELSDQFIVKANNGFSVDVTAGTTGHPSFDRPIKVYLATPVMFNGQAGYLDYCDMGTEVGRVDTVSLSKSATDPLDVFTGTYKGKTYNLSVLASYIDEDGLDKGQSLATAKTDANYSQLAKFVTSAKYE